MKKTGILLMMLLVASVASAQDKMFSYGVKAGMNMSSFVGKDADGAKMMPGYHAGIVTEFRLGSKFAVSPELLYSAQGAKAKNVEDVDVDVKSKFGYLNLPLMVKFYATKCLSIDLGPQLGYAISAKAKVGDQTVKIESDDYKAFDIAAAVGATYNFGKVFAQARYNYGLTSIAPESKASNSVIQLSVGYKF